MALLQQPRRQPAYRANRPHENFLCKLRDVYPGTRSDLVEGLCGLPALAGWSVEEWPVEEAEALVRGRRHVRSSRPVTIHADGSTSEGKAVHMYADGT
jgi:hypothetical protein